VQFGILGPLEVVVEDRRVRLAGPSQRALLALLLLHANEVVSSDRLLDALWAGVTPGSGLAAPSTTTSSGPRIPNCTWGGGSRGARHGCGSQWYAPVPAVDAGRTGGRTDGSVQAP
jgi:hypothetical protein